MNWHHDIFFLLILIPLRSTLFPYTTLFRSRSEAVSRVMAGRAWTGAAHRCAAPVQARPRSEEHTSELQSRLHLVCRLLLEKKKKTASDVRDESVSVTDKLMYELAQCYNALH